MAYQRGFLNGIPILEQDTATGIPVLNANDVNGDMLFYAVGILATRQSPHVVDSIAGLSGISGDYLISGQSYQTLSKLTSDDGSGRLYNYFPTGKSGVTIDDINYVAGIGADDYFANVSRFEGTDDQDASEVTYTGTTPVNYTPTDPHVEGHLEGIDDALGSLGGGGGAGLTGSYGFWTEWAGHMEASVQTIGSLDTNDWDALTASSQRLDFSSPSISSVSGITVNTNNFLINKAGRYNITAIVNHATNNAGNAPTGFFSQLIGNPGGVLAVDGSYLDDRAQTSHYLNWQGDVATGTTFDIRIDGQTFASTMNIRLYSVRVSPVVN